MLIFIVCAIGAIYCLRRAYLTDSQNREKEPFAHTVYVTFSKREQRRGFQYGGPFTDKDYALRAAGSSRSDLLTYELVSYESIPERKHRVPKNTHTLTELKK